ncbi:MAG TPA: dUTP diphosphatase [Epulopiscium sp.]|nr:dUTP diphosphatase [Candidatus Epulonipiscium sp.]
MVSQITLKIKQTDDAKDLPLPFYMTKGAAGMDLYANISDTITLGKGEIKVIKVGICIAVPDGFEAQIRPRSGLAAKYGIGLVNSPGTIDSDYRGEIRIIMINYGEKDFLINRGDRIAQMVINKIEIVTLKLEEILDNTEREDGGFGHTGI